MISKTIGCRGTQHFQTNPYRTTGDLSRLNDSAPVVPATATAWERPDWSPAMRPAAFVSLAPQPTPGPGEIDSD